MPTEEQVTFFRRIIDAPDSAFDKVEPLLAPQYERMMKGPFPRNWRSALELAGLTVPVDGLESNPWEIVFRCHEDNLRWLFTCGFDNGKPTYVTVDT